MSKHHCIDVSHVQREQRCDVQSDEPSSDVPSSKIESDDGYDDDDDETCDAPRDGCGEETREWWERKVCGWNHKAQRGFRQVVPGLHSGVSIGGLWPGERNDGDSTVWIRDLGRNPTVYGCAV